MGHATEDTQPPHARANATRDARTEVVGASMTRGGDCDATKPTGACHTSRYVGVFEPKLALKDGSLQHHAELGGKCDKLQAPRRRAAAEIEMRSEVPGVTDGPGKGLDVVANNQRAYGGSQLT